jgi:DNA ligase 1
VKAFASLYGELDATTSTTRKVAAMRRHFTEEAPADAAWAAWFLAGARPKRLLPMRLLRETAVRVAGIPDWLFEESYQAVGDLAETIALLLPLSAGDDEAGLGRWMRERLLPMRGADPAQVAEALLEAWRATGPAGRLVVNKLLTGGLRVGVSRQLVIRALAEAAGIDPAVLADRFIGYADGQTEPDAQAFLRLVRPGEDGPERSSRPYPFFLAQPLQQPAASLGEPSGWLVEWKWDGIRAQLLRRDGRTWIWSRGEELVTDRFPEVVAAAQALPDGVVLDGELLCWDAATDRPSGFTLLQKRIGRLKLSPRVIAQAPVVMLAYDLLEQAGEDLRARPLAERRRRLESLGLSLATSSIGTSALLDTAAGWPGLARLRDAARERGVEGLMLKRADAAYGIGRTRSSPLGDWWKWKVDPLTVDCVLVYAQRGHGRRASLYTDYTFAVWNAPPDDPQRRLVPFAKAYSGLTDEEIRRVDERIRRTTIERFGPVRSVTPSMVFELGFEAIQRSPRHRSGIAVRFPRILRIRDDKPLEEADTLEQLHRMMAGARP